MGFFKIRVSGSCEGFKSVVGFPNWVCSQLGLQKRVQVSNEGIDTGGLGFQMEVLDMDWRFKQRCQIKVATKGGIRFQIWVLRFQINVAI